MTASPDGIPRELAQRFIGRCIFTWYLLDRGIAQPFLTDALSSDLSEMFASTAKAFALFEWLRKTFNGDLFPMDDPGAEREHLTEKHLALIREFVECRSLVPEHRGQGRLFRFRFDAIPVDLISSIYQQFARSAAADEAASQGLHYTPVELVHLTLDPVFEGLPATSRILDPTCGSGAFLVEAFRRSVWRAAAGNPAHRKLVRDILYNQLFGIDINRSALGIAAFSLYLAALELDEEPISDIRDLKFDHLINTTLFEADTVGNTLPAKLKSAKFDAVVGNPPWTFVSRRNSAPKRNTNEPDTLRPRRSPDQQFLSVAADFAGERGRIGMLMKATPFFSNDGHAIDARSALLKRLAPAALINLSLLRKQSLFPDATGPALLFFARCALSSTPDHLLVGSIPWTPDFERTGVFHLGPADVRRLPLKAVLATPSLIKAAAFGTARDGWLIAKLHTEFPSLKEVLDTLGIRANVARGQGFIVGGQPQVPVPPSHRGLRIVRPGDFMPFRTQLDDLRTLEATTLHRPRSRSIYRKPLVLCPKGSYTSAIERGRYSAALINHDVLYTQNLFGISFASVDHEFAHALSAILNSTITTFQLAFGGPTWGLERPTVGPEDLLSLRIPDLTNCDRKYLIAMTEAEGIAAADPQNTSAMLRLDETVCDLYDLEPDERTLVAESISRARHLIFENPAERIASVEYPTVEVLKNYAKQVCRSVDAYLRARGKRHLEGVIYGARQARGDLAEAMPGATAVRFIMEAGPPGPSPIVREGNPTELETLEKMLRGRLEFPIPPYLSERRELRIYGSHDLFILKPTQTRYWTATAGLNDADLILADHWLRR